MKHTRVPRTVRRDIWRLAIETSSIPSLHIFRSRIRNHIASRIENRKKPNGPNRKSNRLTKKKKIHVPGATLSYYLGWLVWCKVYIRYELRFLQRCRGNSICRKLLQTKRVWFVQTLYQHQSALPYMGCCTLSSCSSNKGPRILRPTIQKNQDVDMYSPWSCCCCCWWWSLGVAPKMKSGRPIKIKIIKYICCLN